MLDESGLKIPLVSLPKTDEQRIVFVLRAVEFELTSQVVFIYRYRTLGVDLEAWREPLLYG